MPDPLLPWQHFPGNEWGWRNPLRAGYLPVYREIPQTTEDRVEGELAWESATSRLYVWDGSGWRQIGGGGGAGGHIVRENGANLPARSALNFASGLVASDDAVNDETDVNAQYAGAGVIAPVSDTAGAGTSDALPRGDHVHPHGSGYLPDAHHPQAHAHSGVDGSGQVSHNSLVDVGADQHHAKLHAHDGTDGSGTVSHASLTGVAADQHHAPNLAGLASARPETAQLCTLYLATDTGELFVWR